MSSAVSPNESPIQQGSNAGVVPPVELRPPEIEEISDANSRGHRPSQSPGQLSTASGIRRPPHRRRVDADAVGGQRGQDNPDRLSPRSAGRRPAGDWWLGLVVLSFLTFNSALAIYLSWGDVGAITFIAFVYVILVFLFFVVKQFQAAPRGSRKKNRLMVSIWILTASLTSGFVYQLVTANKPTLQLIELLWAMPAATAISVFIVFSDRSGTPASDEEMLV